MPRSCGTGSKRSMSGSKKARQSADFGLAGGVSQSTLDAIAACESGGNPAAVDSSGTYYGLYQFDTGTWASVGGSGSPAGASAAEQSYRASLLYAAPARALAGLRRSSSRFRRGHPSCRWT